MPLNLKSWLATLHKAVCATAQPEGLAERVLEVEYPRLLKAGYDLLPNVAVDLACLYQLGERAHFKAPTGAFVRQELFGPYCACLNAAGGEGPLHRAIRRAHTLRSLSNGEGASEDGQRLPGLSSFLQLAARLLPRAGGSTRGADELWRQVREVRREAWDGKLVKDALRLHARDTDALRMLEDFLKDFSGEELRAAPEAEGLLTLALARAPAAVEGLDMALLQSCLDYSPLELDDPGTRRLPVAAIRPKETRRSRSPEGGNHGMDRKGPATAVLRSYLARDDFVERYHRHEVLYFQRYAPQLEPRRILLAWVVERGDAMCVRISGGNLRLDTAALRLVAASMEDAVRHLVRFPVLELHVTVILHNGEAGADLRGALLEPTWDELRFVAGINSRKGELWLPRLSAFMPQFFLREPDWPHHDPFEKTPPNASACERALKLICLAPFRAEMDTLDGGPAFDLAHVSLLGREERLPAEGAERRRLLQALNYVSGAAGLHAFTFDETRIGWSPWPPLRDDPAARPADGYGYGADDMERLRRGFWNDLVGRLLML